MRIHHAAMFDRRFGIHCRNRTVDTKCERGYLFEWAVVSTTKVQYVGTWICLDYL